MELEDSVFKGNWRTDDEAVPCSEVSGPCLIPFCEEYAVSDIVSIATP